MKKIISRVFKKMLVYSKQDKLMAELYEKTRVKLFERMIPDWTYYNQEAIRIVKRQGVIFKLNPSDFSQWQILSNDNFVHVQVALELLRSQGSGIILDIGANCGHFSLILGKYIYKKKWKYQVISFEPNPRVFDLLSNNLSLNAGIADVVKLNNLGVGSDRGVLELQVPLRNSGAGSMLRNYEHEPHEKYKIDIISIDEFLQNDDTRVQFMKIDVENFELNVLNGAYITIKKFRPAIFLEINEGDLDHTSKIVSFLEKLDYRLYVKHNAGYKPFHANSNTRLTDLIAVYKTTL